ncbi:MAG: hypothetical protein OSJ31_08700 [Alistipes sp.]|nr:hypothetical protein [Alistipes sp.]
MKSIFNAAALIVACVSCSTSEPSLQQRAEQLAKTETVKNLFIPESYSPVKTRVDSMFVSAYNDPEILLAAARIIEAEDEYYNNAPYLLFPGDNDIDYDEARETIAEQIDIIRLRAADLAEGVFCGWSIRHRFRADDRLGNTAFGETLFIADKDLSPYWSFDLDSNADINLKRFKRLINKVVDGKYDRFGLGDAQPHADVTVQSPRAKRSLPAHTSHDAPSAGSICDMVVSVFEAGAEVAEDDMAAAGSEVSAAVVDKVSKEDNSVADIFGHGDACELSGDVVAGLNLN